MALVELRGAVHRRVAPDGSTGLSEDRGATKIRVRGLKFLDAGRVGPDHEVRVGAQAGDVVDAANHDALVFETLEEQAGVLDRSFPIIAQHTGFHLEHGEHEVTDFRVQFVEIKACHGSIVPLARISV